MLKNNHIRKFYLTIVDGVFTKREVWKDRLERNENNMKSFVSDSGKEAVTIFNPLISFRNKTLALIEIKSGRTHQIRVQCSEHGRPLTGDIKYNTDRTYNSYFLAAISLTFNKKSDILNINRVSIPLESIDNVLFKKYFKLENLNEIKLRIQKELNNE